MGWKSVKEHYRIKHHVQVTDEGICIGSSYVHNLIVVSMDGRIIKRYDDDRSNMDLHRYQQEMDADPELLRRLVQAEDTFEVSIPVYTFKGADIIEKYCEKPGYPNVTHDGCMQYDNEYSTDKAQVVAWAKHNAEIGIRAMKECIQHLEEQIAGARIRLAAHQAAKFLLEAEYPDIPASD